MSPRGAGAILARAAAGYVCGVVAGFLAFNVKVFEPAHPAFQCLTVGGALALVLALVRAGRTRLALAIVVAFFATQVRLAAEGGWRPAVAMALWSAAIAAGMLLVAGAYELLDAGGLRFGKFLILGPAFAGVYFAATPAATLWGTTPSGAFRNLLFNLLLGIVIGDGVGLGVELAETALGRSGDGSPDSVGPRSPSWSEP